MTGRLACGQQDERSLTFHKVWMPDPATGFCCSNLSTIISCTLLKSAASKGVTKEGFSLPFPLCWAASWHRLSLYTCDGPAKDNASEAYEKHNYTEPDGNINMYLDITQSSWPGLCVHHKPGCTRPALLFVVAGGGGSQFTFLSGFYATFAIFAAVTVRFQVNWI